MKRRMNLFEKNGKALMSILLAGSVLFYASCSDDPEPVNEEELITTVKVQLTPTTEGESIELKFVDLDGDGAGAPVITPETATLKSGTTYTATLSYLNESGSTPEDITEEIEEEKNDHLICYAITTADIEVGYNDEDDNSNPIGLATTWVAGDVGAAGTIKITLRHQPGEKTGACPGAGDTDVEVTFSIQVVE